MNITVQEIDPFGKDVYNFRKEIITVDEQSSARYIENSIDREPNMPEEVWKYSTRKWQSLQLSRLYGVYINNNLACISGCKVYGDRAEFLRLGMHYYVLKRFRQKCRSMLWKPSGIIETALSDFADIEYSFVSIYAHNSRLENWCKALMRGKRYGQIGNGRQHISLLKSYSMKEHPICFKGVPQHILHRKECKSACSYNDFISQIQD